MKTVLLLISISLLFSSLKAQQWANQGSTNIYNTNSGYVGIGTGSSTAPSQPLSVIGTAQFNGSSSQTIAYTRISWNAIGGTGASTFDNHRDLGTTAFVFRTTTGTNAFSELMRMDASGNMGIGTTSPASKLDVAGPTSIGSGSVNGNTTKMFFRNPAGKTWAISSGLNLVNEVDFGIYNWTDNASTPLLDISSTGRVGIGVVNPAGFLHIKGSSAATNADINLETNNGQAKWQLISIQSTNNFAIADVVSSTSPFVINKGAPNNSVTITNNGNLLINENPQINTTYKLDVGGAARANKVVVNTSGADFVFDSSYELKPLSEVENYISLNKHLPEIAPAAEMQKEGIDLGENQTKLLQKVEELTLYLIEQNKKIEALQKEIERVKKKRK